MTEKRFIYTGYSIWDSQNENRRVSTEKAYKLLNELDSENKELKNENEQLKQKLKKYEKIEELKKENFINCHNCKNDRSVHDGVTLDGMCCIEELMNIDGYLIQNIIDYLLELYVLVGG